MTPHTHPGGGKAGIPTEGETPGTLLFSFIHPFLSLALCLAQGWMWQMQRTFPW